MESPVPVRIPKEVLEKIDAEGKRGTVINRILREHYFVESIQALARKKGKAVGELTIGSVSELSFYESKQMPIEAFTEKYIKPAVVSMVAEAAGHPIREHDPKTCRVYGCLMCKAEK